MYYRQAPIFFVKLMSAGYKTFNVAIIRGWHKKTAAHVYDRVSEDLQHYFLGNFVLLVYTIVLPIILKLIFRAILNRTHSTSTKHVHSDMVAVSAFPVVIVSYVVLHE